jgi:hypothetical protein
MTKSTAHFQDQCQVGRGVICNMWCKSCFCFLMEGWGCGLNSGLHSCKAGILPLEPHFGPFCSGYFGDGGFTVIFPSGCQTSNLVISDFQIYRIIVISHQCPAEVNVLTHKGSLKN